MTNKPLHQPIIDEIIELREQRDALLAACKAALNAIETLPVVPTRYTNAINPYIYQASLKLIDVIATSEGK